eukprot:RCo021060
MEHYCWDCKRRTEVSLEEGGALLCKACGGAFVEKVEDDDRPENFSSSSGGPPQGTPASGAAQIEPGAVSSRIQVVVAPGNVAGNFANIFQQMMSFAMGDRLPLQGFGAPMMLLPAGGGPAGTWLRAHPSPHFGSLDALLAHLLETYDGPMGTPPTSAEVFSSLPELSVSTRHTEAHEGCSICKEDFMLGEKMRELPCTHHFHNDCIQPWLTRHSTCPTCRYQLPTEDAVMEGR